MREITLPSLSQWTPKRVYDFWLFTDIDEDASNWMDEISGSLEFDILGE